MNNEVSNQQIYDLLLKMDERLNNMDERLNNIENKQEMTIQAIKEVKEELQNHSQRLDRIDDKLDTTSKTTAYLTRDVYLLKNER